MNNEDQAIFCPKCKQKHEADFESVFLGSWHYIKGYCKNCDYRLLQRCDHLGMGINHLPKEELLEKVKECFRKG